MSATEDFAGARKTAIERSLLLRETTSSVKKRPYFPKNLMPLVPLDLNQFRREELEAAEDAYKENKNETNSVTENTRKNNLSIDTVQEEEEFNEIKIISKENVTPAKHVPLKNIDDSFDLNFSPLSIHTPLKNGNTSNKTHGFLKIPVENHRQSSKFDSFATPETRPLPMKIQCSLPRSTLTYNSTTAPKNTVLKPEVNQNNVCSKQQRTSPEDKFNKLIVKNIQYIILNLLGRGGSSVVYQCYCLERKMIVAIKCVSLENSVSAQGYINEVELLQRLQGCDRIIKLYDYQILEEEKKLFMVLEKGGDDLSAVLRSLASQKMNIPLYMLIFYWMEMLQAVKQIHSNGVIHADIKPSNFITGNKGLKLIDFGIASTVQSDMTSVIKSVPEGSCNYMSPEALNNEASSPEKLKYKLHYKSDVWSLGCILYELVYKKTPFQHIKILWTKLSYIMNPDHTIEYPDAKWLPPKVINTIKNCLQYNVKSRPSVEELIAEYDHF